MDEVWPDGLRKLGVCVDVETSACGEKDYPGHKIAGCRIAESDINLQGAYRRDGVPSGLLRRIDANVASVQGSTVDVSHP